MKITKKLCYALAALLICLSVTSICTTRINTHQEVHAINNERVWSSVTLAYSTWTILALCVCWCETLDNAVWISRQMRRHGVFWVECTTLIIVLVEIVTLKPLVDTYNATNDIRIFWIRLLLLLLMILHTLCVACVIIFGRYSPPVIPPPVVRFNIQIDPPYAHYQQEEEQPQQHQPIHDDYSISLLTPFTPHFAFILPPSMESV